MSEPDEVGHSTAASHDDRGTAPVSVLGDTRCPWGSRDCDRCVVDVEAQFARLGRPPSAPPDARFTYFSGAEIELEGMTAPLAPLVHHQIEIETGFEQRHGGHVQGFNRIPGVRDDNWVVASLSTKPSLERPYSALDLATDPILPRRPAGLLLAHIFEADGRAGLPLAAPGADPDLLWVPGQREFGPKPSLTMRSRVFHIIPETRHAGGLQRIGRIITVASYCDGPEDRNCRVGVRRRAFVDFIEVSECSRSASGVCTTLVNRKILPRQVPAKKAFYAAVARLHNGHYLLAVNRRDSGKTEIFVSSNGRIDGSTDWDKRFEIDIPGKKPQNLNFVTDCTEDPVVEGGGQLYALAFRQRSPKWNGDNRIDLYRLDSVDLFGIDAFTLTHVNTAGLPEADGACEMRGGAGAYAGPGGELIVYCSQGRSVWTSGEDPFLLNFSEFAGSTPGCGDGVRTDEEQCDEGDTANGACTLDGRPCENVGSSCGTGGACDFDGCSSVCGRTTSLCAGRDGSFCETSGDCPSGERCRDDGCCEPLRQLPPACGGEDTCDGRADCGANRTCNEGCCECLIGPCSSDDDCSGRNFCGENDCCQVG